MTETTETKETQAEQVIKFADLKLAPPIMQALEEAGYDTPTPIQAQAIPVVLSGKDLMAGAQTGTGKTAAFGLPLLQQILPKASSSTSPAKHPIRALILAPTRELAIQVEENIAEYAKHTPLRTLVVYGGVDIKTQTPKLKAGVEILVATPGRLLDHVEQKTLNLNQVQMLVLDEADRMLDMGFMPDLKRILALLPKQRQNLMFSATFSKEIKKLSDDFLNNPQLIEVARSNATNENVTQTVYPVAQADKQRLVIQLLQGMNNPQVIIFTKTKLAASRLSTSLSRADISADAIHGNKSQKERMKTLDAFKSGTVKALVATDVAARGLDITDLPMVINYEIPSTPEDYVHRIGRTGRGGASGKAISLVCKEEEESIAAIEKLTKQKLQREQVKLARPTRESSNSSRNNSNSTRTRGRRNQKPQDPWFDTPYTPDPNQAAKTTAMFTSKSNAPVAALLGGLVKKPVTASKKKSN